MCYVRCAAQIGFSWDSLGIEDASVCNYSSLSERGVQHLNIGLGSTIFFSG